MAVGRLGRPTKDLPAYRNLILSKLPEMALVCVQSRSFDICHVQGDRFTVYGVGNFVRLLESGIDCEAVTKVVPFIWAFRVWVNP